MGSRWQTRRLGLLAVALLGACGGRSEHAPRADDPNAGAGGGGQAETGGVDGANDTCVVRGPEVCNGLDDDCDGEIDEDLPLEVADGPVVVRSDEGRTDQSSPEGCESCRWAWHAAVIAPGNTLSVIWHLGINALSLQPTSFGRRLSWELEPNGSVVSLGKQYWLNQMNAGQSDARGTLVTFETEDLIPSFELVSPDLAEGTPTGLAACNSNSNPDMLAPLAPGLLGCTTNDGVAHLYGLDASVRLAATHDIDLRLPGEMRGRVDGQAVAAIKGDRGLWVAPYNTGTPDGRQMVSVEISPDGAATGEPLRQHLDPWSYLSPEGLFATRNGYLLFGYGGGADAVPRGHIAVPLDDGGTQSGPLVAFDDKQLDQVPHAAAAAIGSGFAFVKATVDGLTLEQLDSDGQLVQRTQQAASPYGEVSVLFAHGAVYVAFVEEQNMPFMANRVWVSRFHCAR